MIALLIGYFGGGIPTADWLARIWGIDLRGGGSGNPGANNARRLGGAGLGATVLAVEVAKGAGIVAAVASVQGPGPSVIAGVAAVAGNVVSPYRRLRGGQGLAITLGVLLAAWPMMTPIVLVVIAAVAVATRRAPAAALSALGSLLFGSAAWAVWDLPTPWGIESPMLGWLAIGLALAVGPKQLVNLIRDRRQRLEVR